MDRKRATVKSSRPYDNTSRQEQARRTRAAIIEEARARFLSDGFGPTTVASIAGAVGVSVDTIYKSFGGKPGLVRAMCEAALAGTGPVPAEARSDALQRTESDPRIIIAGFGALSAEVAPRIAPLLLLLRDAAATDPEMAQLRADLDDERLARMTHNARNLARAGHLREGVTVKQAGEVMWTYSSPELYELLVVRRRWSITRYAAFIADAMVAALL